MSSRISEDRLAELTQERTFAWAREHWTLLPCKENSRLKIINGSDFHWVERELPLGTALERIGNYLRDVASDTRILAHAAKDAQTPTEQLAVDGYLEAVADASRVFDATHEEINRKVKGIYRRNAIGGIEPSILMPQRVSLLGERTELPTPEFRRGRVPLGAGATVTDIVFPKEPYSIPVAARTRHARPTRRALTLV